MFNEFNRLIFKKKNQIKQSNHNGNHLNLSKFITILIGRHRYEKEENKN